MGGLETVAALREAGSTLPVFVSSGYAEDMAVANPKEYGFTASIRKPYTVSELAELLQQYL